MGEQWGGKDLILGINLPIIGNKRTSFTYYSEKVLPILCRRLDGNINIVSGKNFPEGLIQGLPVHRLPYAIGAGEGNMALGLRYLWQYWGMKSYEKRNKLDLWYSPTHHGRIGTGIPQVITVHDLIPLHFPNQNPIQTEYFKRILPKVINASRRVIVVSESTKKDLVSAYRIDEEKVDVVHLGFDNLNSDITEMDFKQVEKNIILVPGAGYPHKNALRVIRAFSLLSQEIRDNLVLVITGAGNQEKELFAEVKKLAIEKSCVIYSYLSIDDMNQLWKRTRLVVYASLWEGFGIPPLEAMSIGIPCIVSKLASLPEVCGKGAVYINPYNVDEITIAITNVIEESETIKEIIRNGYSQVKRFDWKRTVEEIEVILRKVSCND